MQGLFGAYKRRNKDFLMWGSTPRLRKWGKPQVRENALEITAVPEGEKLRQFLTKGGRK